MKLIKSILLHTGTLIPVGTELHFGNEGLGYYEGEQVKLSSIPMVALESNSFKTIGDVLKHFKGNPGLSISYHKDDSDHEVLIKAKGGYNEQLWLTDFSPTSDKVRVDDTYGDEMPVYTSAKDLADMLSAFAK